MKIEQSALNSVESKLNRQNLVHAAAAVSFWLIPIVVFWYFIYQVNGDMAPVMFLAAGAIIGGIVRLHGKGFKRRFSVLALMMYIWVCLLAFGLEIVVKTKIWGVILFGLFAMGAWISIYVARRRVPFREHKAYDHLADLRDHQINSKKRNAWYIALPIACVLSVFSSVIVVWSIVSFNIYEEFTQLVMEEEKVLQEKRGREIDITPQALKKLNSKEILRYSNGYYTGNLFDARGHSVKPFTRSKYKALNMLRFLANERHDHRAKFLLGLLSNDSNSPALMQEAMKAGDPFAQMYLSIQFGCRGHEEKAKQLLSQQLKLTNDRLVRSEIESVLYVSINTMCREFEQPEFHWLYVKQYKQS